MVASYPIVVIALVNGVPVIGKYTHTPVHVTGVEFRKDLDGWEHKERVRGELMCRGMMVFDMPVHVRKGERIKVHYQLEGIEAIPDVVEILNVNDEVLAEYYRSG